MRFILNEFPDDDSFQPDENWIPLKESTNLWIIQLQALPFVIINMVLMIVLMKLIGINFKLNIITMLISFLVFMPVHEFIHALFFPESLSSKKVYFGFTTKGFALFAAYTGEMKRNTFIKSLLAPFIIISVLGFAYLLLFGSNELVEHIIAFNAAGACADCLGVFLIATQVPGQSMVRNKKIKTFWKADNSATLNTV